MLTKLSRPPEDYGPGRAHDERGHPLMASDA